MRRGRFSKENGDRSGGGGLARKMNFDEIEAT